MHPTLDDLKKTSRVKKIVQGNHFFQISCFHDIMLISNRALYSSKSLNTRMLHLSSTRILEEVRFNPKPNVNSFLFLVGNCFSKNIFWRLLLPHENINFPRCGQMAGTEKRLFKVLQINHISTLVR